MWERGYWGGEMRGGEMGGIGVHAHTQFGIPVLYFTQLMGIAFGIDGKALGLDKLVVKADTLVARIKEPNTARKGTGKTGDVAKGGNAA